MRPLRGFISASLLIAIAAVALHAAEPAAAPDSEFQAVQKAIEQQAPGDDLMGRIYSFMERYPHDPRGDQVQFWAGAVQQRRKFHNEAAKEFGFVVSDFPKSRLVLPALAAQVESWHALAKPDNVAACYQEVLRR